MPRGRPWSEAERVALLAGAEMLPGRTTAGCASEAGRLQRRSAAGKYAKPQAASSPARATRRCLTCRNGFTPAFPGNFVCGVCKKHDAWQCGA